MMDEKIISKKSNIDGTIAGGSGGALLIVLSENLTSHPLISNLLLYLSPSIAIGASLFWKYAKVQIEISFKEYKFRRYVKKCQYFLTESLKDPNLSGKRKKELKEKYDILNELISKAHFNRINSVELHKEDYVELLDSIKIK
ncbi:hypothetical protein [Aureivirga marina]|uniref:hypothetical protein n=1 Tax=Aureivirga marina TaxID=1182451 RepID=UPI0018C99DB3|nr:hypothetical protein [Aureivirga marina]